MNITKVLTLSGLMCTSFAALSNPIGPFNVTLKNKVATLNTCITMQLYLEGNTIYGLGKRADCTNPSPAAGSFVVGGTYNPTNNSAIISNYYAYSEDPKFTGPKLYVTTVDLPTGIAKSNAFTDANAIQFESNQAPDPQKITVSTESWDISFK